MSVDFDLFLNWAESRFDSAVVSGDEIKLNSIFCHDVKHHLWCNPSGGKNNLPYGVFHCWKTDKKGSLITLVMLVDKCSFDEALETLEKTNSNLEDLEKRVDELFNKKQEETYLVVKEKIALPYGTYKFEDLPSYNKIRSKAELYLKNRKINLNKVLVCVSGEYRNRVVIPYYDKEDNLIYYNTRSLSDFGLRYLGPPKKIGVGKGDVLFVPEWKPSGEKIYLCEGEFDALSLSQAGHNSAAFGGKNLSEEQIKIIEDYIPVLCLDADSAGGDALIKMGEKLLEKGFKEIYYVRAPKQFKDWNSMLINSGEKIIKFYIKLNEKRFDFTTNTLLNGLKI